MKTEELVAKGIEVVDEFAWEEIDYLRPGMDYKNGVTFITVPMPINRIITKKVGKETIQKSAVEPGIGCITSEGDRFEYSEERVAQKGYAYPDTVTTAQRERGRWSMKSIKEFVNGEHTTPNPATIYEGIKNIYEEYVEFDRQEMYEIMPLFVMGTYMFRLFTAMGYVHFNGSKASGKSQNLSILDALAFNAYMTSSMTESSLFRVIAGDPGTVLVDEAEGFDGERGETLRRILNSGYKHGGSASRTERGPNENFVVRNYEVYGPKALASIKVQDDVLASRCIVVTMRPTLKDIQPFNKDLPRWGLIRDRLFLWAMTAQPEVKKSIDEWNEFTRFERAKDLKARDWEITQSYIILADYLDKIDGDTRCDRLIAYFSEYFAESKKNSDATDRLRLVLRTLPRVLATKEPFDEFWYPLKSIHEVVSEYIEEDAKEYFKTRTLSKYLDSLGFKTRRPHRQGQQVWLDHDVVRKEITQRRVEVDKEDSAWLNGEVQYNVHRPSRQDTTDDIWSSVADEEKDEFAWH